MNWRLVCVYIKPSPLGYCSGQIVEVNVCVERMVIKETGEEPFLPEGAGCRVSGAKIRVTWVCGCCLGGRQGMSLGGGFP